MNGSKNGKMDEPIGKMLIDIQKKFSASRNPFEFTVHFYKIRSNFYNYVTFELSFYQKFG